MVHLSLLNGSWTYPELASAIGVSASEAHAAPPLRDQILASTNDVIPVWPDPNGDARGEAWAPLYPRLPAAAKRIPALYEALALLDSIRGGRARERTMAIAELTKRLA